MDRGGAGQIRIAVAHQHFGHLALELRVAPLKEVAHPVRLEFMGVADGPCRDLSRASTRNCWTSLIAYEHIYVNVLMQRRTSQRDLKRAPVASRDVQARIPHP